MPNFTHEDYVKMVDEAERELSALLAKAESSEAAGEPLAKSEDADKKDDKKADAKEEPAKAEDEKKDDEKKDDDESHDYDDEDQEEMHKMYHSMSKGELKLHKDSVDKCWMGKCGEMSVAKSEEKPTEVSLAKSEDAEALKKSEEAASLLKNELDAAKGKLDESAKENAELKKSIGELTAALDGFLKGKGPVRKAITSIEIVKKSEIESGNKPEAKELTKSEIKAKLTQKASDPSLSKSDRVAINKYCMVEGTSLDTVKHLLS
jgi:hypothetical protein